MDIEKMYDWPNNNEFDVNEFSRNQAKEIETILIIKDFLKRYGIVDEGSKGYGDIVDYCPNKIYILFSVPIKSELSDDRAIYKNFNNMDMRDPKNLIEIYKTVHYDYISNMFCIGAEEDIEVKIIYGTSEEAKNRYKQDMMNLVKEKIKFACKRRADDIWTNEKYDNEIGRFNDSYDTPEYKKIFKILAE